MGRLIDEGLIQGWGLSQVDVAVIDRAQKVTSLTAIQNIYSMVERDVEKAVIPYCMEHSIGFVPFSPIASGLLSGKITTETMTCGIGCLSLAAPISLGISPLLTF